MSIEVICRKQETENLGVRITDSVVLFRCENVRSILAAHVYFQIFIYCNDMLLSMFNDDAFRSVIYEPLGIIKWGVEQ